MKRFVSVGGSHAEIGYQLGQECREGIGLALRHVGEEIAKFTTLEEAKKRAEKYLPYIEQDAGHMVDELEGLADGAGISMAEALMLQLRFEIVGFDGQGGDGCSSFAIVDGGHRATGQNVDAPSWHKALGMVLEMRTPEGPDLLMYNYYPGMIGYLGINSAGLSVFGNAVVSPGWRIGFPRYLAVRLALEQETVAAAEAKIRQLHRASTINLMITDADGTIRDLELDVEEVGALDPVNGRLFHTNHYLCEALLEKERLLPLIPDTVDRLRAGRKRLRAISLSQPDVDIVATMRELLTDHSNHPASICRHKAEVSKYDGDQWESIGSIIAEPDHGRMNVCFGNPCELEYEEFGFTDVGRENFETPSSAVASGG